MAARGSEWGFGIVHDTTSSKSPGCGSQALPPHGQQLNYWQDFVAQASEDQSRLLIGHGEAEAALTGLINAA
jgi:hypothetical protein